jgi:peptidase C25-like protein
MPRNDARTEIGRAGRGARRHWPLHQTWTWVAMVAFAPLLVAPAGASAATVSRDIAQVRSGLSAAPAAPAFNRSRAPLLQRLSNAERLAARGRRCDAVVSLRGFRVALRTAQSAPANGLRAATAADIEAATLGAEVRLLASQTARGCGGAAMAAGRTTVRVLRSTPTGVDLRLTVGRPRFRGWTGHERPYQQVQVPEAGESLQSVGQPDLPSLRRLVAIPTGATARVRVLRRTTVTVGAVQVLPTQVDKEDVLDDTPAEFLPKPFAKSARAYRRASPVPARQAYLGARGRMRDLTVQEVALALATYRARSGRLDLTTTLDVRIEFRGRTRTFGSGRALSEWEPGSRSLYRAAVVNAATALRNLTKIPRLRVCGTEMMVIHTPDFATAAKSLVTNKIAAGVMARRFEIAPGTSAAAIRTLIRGELTSNCAIRPSWVMLLGDVDRIPAFQRISSSKPGVTINTDYPFGDLADDPLEYSEDVVTDAVVGRIPARTPADAEAVVDKLRRYDAGPGPPLITRALVAGQFETRRKCVANPGFEGTPNCDPDAGTVTGQYELDTDNPKERYNFLFSLERVRGGVLGSGPNRDVERQYWARSDANPGIMGDGTPLPAALKKPAFPWDADGASVVAAFGRSPQVVFYDSHGGTSSWGHPNFGSGNIASLAATDEPPMVFSIACYNGAYTGQNQGFAENLVNRPDGGAAGVLAADVLSNTGTNGAYVRGLADGLFPAVEPNEGPEALTRVGDVIAAGRAFVVGKSSAAAALRHIWMYNWFGDPSARVKVSHAITIRRPDLRRERRFIFIDFGDPPPGDPLVTVIVDGQPMARGIATGRRLRLATPVDLTGKRVDVVVEGPRVRPATFTAA